MMFCTILKIVFLLQAVRVVAGEYCQYDDSFSYSYKLRYCTYGCCGNKDSDYSEVCCSYNYNSDSIDSSSSSAAPVEAIVGAVLGSVAGLAVLIGIIKCCCAAINSSSRQTGTVIQPANTPMQTFVVNTTAVPQVQPAIPVQQGAVGYVYPCPGSPPPYRQNDNVSQKTADVAYPPPQEAKY